MRRTERKFNAYYQNLPMKHAFRPVIIERIDTHFKDSAIPLFERLTGFGNSESACCPITFDFLRLEHFQLSDELYICMNARGKQLTEFEHFKVLFSGYLSNPEEKAKLDNEWLDIFWTHARGQAEKNRKEISSDMTDTVDRYFFAFFHSPAGNFMLKNKDFQKMIIFHYYGNTAPSTKIQRRFKIP